MSVLLSLDTAEFRCGPRMNCGSKQSEFLSMSEWLFGRIFIVSRYFGRGEEFASSKRNCASAQLLKKITPDIFHFCCLHSVGNAINVCKSIRLWEEMCFSSCSMQNVNFPVQNDEVRMNRMTGIAFLFYKLSNFLKNLGAISR